MKKLFLTAILLCILLCGCSPFYVEPEQTVIVSAIGIDTAGETLLLTVETVDTSSPDGNSEYSPKTLEAKGENCEGAFDNLQQTLGNKLTCHHCVLIVKGDGLSDTLLKECLLYLHKEQHLSQNTKIVTSKSAGALLKAKSYTGQAVGFDAVKILSFQVNKSQLLECNLYSVLRILQSGNKPLLPSFETQNGGYFLEAAKNE